jgi:hypothetical protein
MGLRVENQAAKCGSRPTRRATRDNNNPIAITPKRAGTRIKTDYQ